MENEIIRIATITARKFIYNNKYLDPNPGNFYKSEDEDEIGGQCSDYALHFVTQWNKVNPDNEAEIVVVNQDCGIQSGSYKIVKEISIEEINNEEIYEPLRCKLDKEESGWLKNVSLGNGEYILVLYHPKIGFYETKQTKVYEVKTHFGKEMAKQGQHVWAKVGDIAIDPCWADTGNTSFIGEDILC